MHRRRSLITTIAIIGLSCAVAGAQEVEGPHAVVTALGGGGATHGADGKAFPTGKWSYYEPDHVVMPGSDPVVTAEDGTAVLTLPGYDTIIHLGDGRGRSELSLNTSRAMQREIPLALDLVSGQALIVCKPDDRRWLLMVCHNEATEGYALSRGASYVARADDDGFTFAVSHGEVRYFGGRVGARLFDNRSELIGREGMIIPAGQSLSTRAPEDLRADADAVPQALNQMNDTVYAFAQTKGTQWIERAEQGDLIPARQASRGVAHVFAEQVGVGRSAFDQPRSPVVVTTPRVTLAPMTTSFRAATVTQNFALSLAQSTTPTEAVVGQRLLRTRIIGNPGTDGGFRANPQLEQLIRLPARED